MHQETFITASGATRLPLDMTELRHCLGFHVYGGDATVGGFFTHAETRRLVDWLNAHANPVERREGDRRVGDWDRRSWQSHGHAQRAVVGRRMGSDRRES